MKNLQDHAHYLIHKKKSESLIKSRNINYIKNNLSVKKNHLASVDHRKTLSFESTNKMKNVVLKKTTNFFNKILQSSVCSNRWHLRKEYVK